LRGDCSWERGRGSTVLDGWEAGAMLTDGVVAPGMEIRAGAVHTLVVATLDAVTLGMATRDAATKGVARGGTFTERPHTVLMERPRVMVAAMAEAALTADAGDSGPCRD